MASPSPKKRKLIVGTAPSIPQVNKKTKDKALSSEEEREQFRKEINFKPIDLAELNVRIRSLCLRVPEVPEDRFELSSHKVDNGEVVTQRLSSTLPQSKTDCPFDKQRLREWAQSMQVILEEFNILVALVGPATYGAFLLSLVFDLCLCAPCQNVAISIRFLSH